MCRYLSVCLSVCVCVCLITSCEQNISQSYERILMIFVEVERGPGTNRLVFGGNPITLPHFAPIFHPRSNVLVFARRQHV